MALTHACKFIHVIIGKHCHLVTAFIRYKATLLYTAKIERTKHKQTEEQLFSPNVVIMYKIMCVQYNLNKKIHNDHDKVI